jgi:hypothetical protein
MPLLLLRTAALAVQRPPEDNQTYRRDAAEPYVQRGQPKPDEYPCDEGREDHCDGPLDPPRTIKQPGHARTAMDVWRIEYNMLRSHQVLDGEVRQRNLSELPQRAKVHASQLWTFSPRGELHTVGGIPTNSPSWAAVSVHSMAQTASPQSYVLLHSIRKDRCPRASIRGPGLECHVCGLQDAVPRESEPYRQKTGQRFPDGCQPSSTTSRYSTPWQRSPAG